MANVTLVWLLPSVNIADVPLEVNCKGSCIAAVLTLKGPFSSVDNLVSLNVRSFDSTVAAVWPRTLVRLELAVLVPDVPHHFTLCSERHPTVLTIEGLLASVDIFMV